VDYPRRFPPNGARLLRVEFLDQDGKPAFRVQQQSDLTVVVHFSVERLIERLDLTMHLTHVEGQRIFSEQYSGGWPRADVLPGDYEVRFSIPLKYLKLESYFLAIGIVEGSSMCDDLDGLPLPELVNEEADPHIESTRVGLVRIPLNWSPIEAMAYKG
jgi:hypothetical protein